MSRIVDELDEFITTLELEHTLIAERLRLARELRATFGPSLVLASDSAPDAGTATTLPPDPVECVRCGATFKSKAGVAIHVGRSHKRFNHQAARDAAAAAV